MPVAVLNFESQTACCARRARRQLRCFRKTDSGAAGLELALAGPVFFLLLLAIFDLAVMSFRDSSLHAAAEAGARVLRTGEVASSADPRAAFVSAVCGSSTGIACSDIIYDVRPYASFGAVSFASLPRNANGEPTGMQFSSGTADGVIAVRLMVRHQFATPYLTEAFARQSTKFYLESTIVLRGEPWE